MSCTFNALVWRWAARLAFGAGGAAAFALGALVHAAPVITVVAEDQFVYPGAVSLVGRNGGTGWAGAWVSDSPSFTDFFTQATGLTVPGVAGAGGKMEFRAAGSQLNDAARNLPLQNSGVVYLQFLSQFGAQSGGGTPSIRLVSSATGLTGGVGNNGGCGAPVYAILSATLSPIPASCSAVTLGTLSGVVLQIDYVANITRMWVLPSLSGFDYLNPPAPSAEYVGLAPAFDRIAIYSRSPARIDELRVFRVAESAPPSAQPIPTLSVGALTALTGLLVLAAVRFGRRSV